MRITFREVRLPLVLLAVNLTVARTRLRFLSALLAARMTFDESLSFSVTRLPAESERLTLLSRKVLLAPGTDRLPDAVSVQEIGRAHV